MSKTSIYTVEFSSVENPDITESEKGKLINNKYFNFQIFRGKDLVVDMNFTSGAIPDSGEILQKQNINAMDLLEVLMRYMEQHQHDGVALPNKSVPNDDYVKSFTSELNKIKEKSFRYNTASLDNDSRAREQE